MKTKKLADKRGKQNSKNPKLIRTVSEQITAPVGYRLIAGFALLKNR
jgi:hypothetical protein